MWYIRDKLENGFLDQPLNSPRRTLSKQLYTSAVPLLQKLNANPFFCFLVKSNLLDKNEGTQTCSFKGWSKEKAKNTCQINSMKLYPVDPILTKTSIASFSVLQYVLKTIEYPIQKVLYIFSWYSDIAIEPSLGLKTNLPRSSSSIPRWRSTNMPIMAWPPPIDLFEWPTIPSVPPIQLGFPSRTEEEFCPLPS